MNPVEACPVHHAVKQLTMTLNALLASAESAFGARVSELVRSCPLHWGSSGDEHESFLLLRLCECIKPIMII